MTDLEAVARIIDPDAGWDERPATEPIRDERGREVGRFLREPLRFDHPVGIAQAKARSAAEAIFAALKEPSMDAKLAGADEVNRQMRWPGAPADYDAAADAWRAMLDQAKREILG